MIIFPVIHEEDLRFIIRQNEVNYYEIDEEAQADRERHDLLERIAQRTACKSTN